MMMANEDLSIARRLRTAAGALAHDVPRFAASVGRGRWIEMRNRDEQLTLDGRGARCEWEFTSELHVANVFPSAGALLMRRAFSQWPIRMRDEPESARVPEVAFVIGHRGTARLDHLLLTLRSIAGQVGAAVEVIVVEQDVEPRVAAAVPDWVRYVFTPCDTDYNRAATLNEGVRAATASVVVLHDNDMLVPAGYAAECRARIADGFDYLELKRFTFYLSESTTRNVFQTGRPSYTGCTVVQNLLGASIVARKDKYLEAGSFDEEFVGWGGEDNEFWERAEATGSTYRFGYLPFVHLFHAPQKGKTDPNAPAIRRYHEIRRIAAKERIARLHARQ